MTRRSALGLLPSDMPDDTGVQEAAAVAHTDSTRGEVVRVVVVAAPGIATDDSLRCKLKEVVAQSVGKYATPRVVDFVDTLPRTEVGKLRRASLRMS